MERDTVPFTVYNQPIAWDRRRVCEAAAKASQRFGQWVPQHWLEQFMQAYEEQS